MPNLRTGFTRSKNWIKTQNLVVFSEWLKKAKNQSYRLLIRDTRSFVLIFVARRASRVARARVGVPYREANFGPHNWRFLVVLCGRVRACQGFL